MRLPKLTTWIISCCLLAALTIAQQKPADDSKDMKDINKAFDDIKKAHEKGAKDDSDEIKKLKTKAIELVDTGYKIPHDNMDGDPTYDPGLDEDQEGDSIPVDKTKNKANNKVKVRIGEKAFSSPGWLASSKLHEIVGHGGQAVGARWPTTAKGKAIAEIEAYDLEISNAEKNGLGEDEIKELKTRRKHYYDKLDEANQKKADKKDYNTLAMVAPPDRSVDELAGTSQVFIAGTVVADEITEVTVRGPRSFEGVVIEVEANGKQVKATPDKKGHARIDLAVLGALSGGTNATVRALDSSGKHLATGQTRVQPGTGVPIRRPELPTIPAQLRNSDVVTLKGNHLGADAQLIVGNQGQETLSASAQEITAFVTASTGQQPVYVVTPYGVSQSQPCQIYTFTLAATKNTIKRGEHVTVSAQYAGLPPGTDISFTNQTANVVQMQARGAAACAGQQCTVTIVEPNGTVSLDLVGQSAGRFVINYDLKFPK